MGSYSLGVHSPGGDIDALCVGPVPAAKFFAELPSLLLKDNEKQVTSVRVRHGLDPSLLPIFKHSLLLNSSNSLFHG